MSARQRSTLLQKPLADLRVLVLEDEFLIAMDVEQICLEGGAADVLVARSLDEIDAESLKTKVDVAIVDVMLSGRPTIDFARELRTLGVPFIFASGYTSLPEIAQDFPDVAVVGKPYAGNDLVEAVVRACGR